MEQDLFADLIVKDLAYSYQPDFPSAGKLQFVPKVRLTCSFPRSSFRITKCEHQTPSRPITCSLRADTSRHLFAHATCSSARSPDTDNESPIALAAFP